MKSTILVIDDDQSMRWLISRVLSDFNVVTKSDGLESLLWLSKGNLPELIILDRGMPFFDGKRLLRGLKGSGLYKEIPVLFVSSWLDYDFVEEVKKLGVTDFIEKPFDPIQLQEKVDQCLSHQTHSF